MKENIEKVKGIHEIPQFFFPFLPHIFFNPQEVVEEVVATPEEPKVEGILSTTPISIPPYNIPKCALTDIPTCIQFIFSVFSNNTLHSMVKSYLNKSGKNKTKTTTAAIIITKD